MRTLNYTPFSILLFALLFSCISSCKDDEQEEQRIEGWDYTKNECEGINYVLNSDGIACECPEDTHYRLEQVPGNTNEITRCVVINSGSFLYKAEISACLYEYPPHVNPADGFENVYDAVGMAEFDFENKALSLWLGNYGPGLTLGLSIFGSNTIGGEPAGMTFHEDGSFSVVYHGHGNWEGQCKDWKERSPDCGQTPFYVTTTGRSNPERTAITLEMVWTNCNQELMDTATIEMWKEW